MKFTVEREKWLRGEGPDNSRLLRPSDGKMCCVGFFCLAEGQPPEKIKNYRTYGVAINNTPYCETFSEIYEINDDRYITDSEREVKLEFEFTKLGHEVEFV